MVANMSMARSAVLAIGGRRIGRRSISPDQPTLWDVRVPLQKASFDKLRMRKKGAENSGLVLSLSKDVLRPEPLEEAKEKPNQPPNADLRRLVETLQRPAARVCRLGVPALDAALPDGGLALGRMHEVVAEDGEAGTGFAALLLARIAGKTGRVLWCGASLYGPGLAAFGLDPDRVIFARTAPGDETLWAMEEGLRCKGLSAVLGESPMLDLTAGRRLQLAAERQGVTAVFLRRPAANRQLRGQTRLDPSAATTRRIAARAGASSCCAAAAGRRAISWWIGAMRRVISLWLPRLATDLLRREWSRRRSPMLLIERPPTEAAVVNTPVATTVQSGGRSLLAAVDDAAAVAGIAPGMGLADARAIVPELVAVAADPAGEARALNALADWCDRYTPAVALSGADGLYLDITGCAHLMGPKQQGESALLADLLRRVRRAGLAAQTALADTPGAAWALARFAETPLETGIVVAPGTSEAALLPLPAAALRLPPGMAEDLSRVGLRRIGDLRRLEQDGGRAPLAARYSDAAWRQFDLALGRAEEPISPRRLLPAYRERLAFAEPIATPEDIARATRRLLAKLCVRLVGTGVGARRIDLAFYRSDGAVSGVGIGTAKPSRDSAHLFHLLRQKLDRVEPGFGIDLATIAAPEVEALAALQIDLPQQPDSVAVTPRTDDGDLAELVDRLGNRLGANHVWRLAPRESYVPERAAQRVKPMSPPALKAWRLPPRPLRLFARPEPIDAIVGAGSGAERDTAPSLFRWRAHLHRVRRGEGPERLSPEWWRPDSDQATRDYWRVEDEAGRRFWLFQRMEKAATPSWFIHGEFA